VIINTPQSRKKTPGTRQIPGLNKGKKGDIQISKSNFGGKTLHIDLKLASATNDENQPNNKPILMNRLITPRKVSEISSRTRCRSTTADTSTGSNEQNSHTKEGDPQKKHSSQNDDAIEHT
jgi:hypothetical protein